MGYPDTRKTEKGIWNKDYGIWTKDCLAWNKEYE